MHPCACMCRCVRMCMQGADFHRDTERLAEALLPAINFRLDAASLEGRHYGEAACRDFRESVLAVLPHRCFTSRSIWLDGAVREHIVALC